MAEPAKGNRDSVIYVLGWKVYYKIWRRNQINSLKRCEVINKKIKDEETKEWLKNGKGYPFKKMA